MHLFAGAGGGLLSDLILGHEPVCAVEWTPYCCEVLRERRDEGWFPGLHVHEGDIREFDAAPWRGNVDLIHAGFPCQDISVAGKGRGLAGERSGLFFEIIRVARAVEPRYIFLENSPAIVTRGLGQVLGALASLGFDAVWQTLAAAEVGANHRRVRWWCLAAHADTALRVREQRVSRGRPEGVRNEGGAEPDDDGPEEPVADAERAERGALDQREQLQAGRIEASDGPRGPGEVVADSDIRGWVQQRLEEHPDEQGAPGDFPDRCGEGGRRDGQERGEGGWWATEPNVGRVADGMAARVHRLTALGNGQVPLQAAVAFDILWKRMEESRER